MRQAPRENTEILPESLVRDRSRTLTVIHENREDKPGVIKRAWNAIPGWVKVVGGLALAGIAGYWAVQNWEEMMAWVGRGKIDAGRRAGNVLTTPTPVTPPLPGGGMQDIPPPTPPGGLPSPGTPAPLQPGTIVG